MTLHTLQLAAPHISASLPHILNLPSSLPPPQPRPNTKWSKILINSVPTGTTNDRSPLSPDECHLALAASNPSYASLSIMQKPSWVCPPTSYKSGSISSLSVAFEDLDGSNSGCSAFVMYPTNSRKSCNNVPLKFQGTPRPRSHYNAPFPSPSNAIIICSTHTHTSPIKNIREDVCFG